MGFFVGKTMRVALEKPCWSNGVLIGVDGPRDHDHVRDIARSILNRQREARFGPAELDSMEVWPFSILL